MRFKDLLALRTKVLVDGETGVVVARTREERPLYDVMLSDGRILKAQPREALESGDPRGPTTPAAA